MGSIFQNYDLADTTLFSIQLCLSIEVPTHLYVLI